MKSNESIGSVPTILGTSLKSENGSALQRIQDHVLRVGNGTRSENGFPPELIPDLKTLTFEMDQANRRLGLKVELSAYLQSILLGEMKYV